MCFCESVNRQLPTLNVKSNGIENKVSVLCFRAQSTDVVQNRSVVSVGCR